ncbi:hypothetical protein BHM03_00062496 [Ensete ventricosum]|nr:hypothetical protein BHM03_00062496 [Ensete ventricosum]
MSYSTNAPAGFCDWPDVQILTAGERRIPAHSNVLVSILWIPQLGSSLHSRVLVEETVVVGVSAVMMEDGTEVSTTITGGRSQDGCLKKGSALIATLVLFDRDHAFLVHFDLHVNFNHDSLPDIFEESHDKDMARAATASHAAPCHEIEPTGNGLECSDGFNPTKT